MDDLRKENKYAFIGRTALLAAVAAFVAILPAVIMGRGMLLLTDDFTWQQQIFSFYNVLVTRTQPAWSWVIDLGSDPEASLSFYNLSSPFTLISAMFPASFAPYLTAPMLILKYVTAAVGAVLFAKKFVKNQSFAALCGLLYAFSGIQTVSLLFPFHDAMALFPWLLYSLEKLIEGRPVVFAFTVALCAMTNYYIFFGEVIFLLIWFVFRVLLMTGPARGKLILLGKTALEGVIGTAAAGLVLVPAFLAVAANPRVGAHETGILYHVTRYITIMQAYFMPADVMGMRNYLFQKGCSSCAMSLPFVAMALVFAYIKKNFKKPRAYLPVVIIVISLVPVLNSAFSAFNTNYYARWFFMPALVFAMMSCVVLDRFSEDGGEESFSSKDLIFGARLNLVCVVLTMLAEVALILWYKLRGVTTLISGVNMTLLIIYGVFGQLCAFGFLFTVRKVKPEKIYKPLIACVLAAGVLTTGAAAVRYSTGTGTSEYYEPGIVNSEGDIGAEKAKAIITSSGELANVLPNDKNYRVRYDWHEEGEDYFADSFDNVSMLTGIPSVNSFISTIDGGLFTFYDLIGTGRNVTTAGSFPEEQMALLSAKYYLTSNPAGGPDGGKKFGEYSYPDGTVVYIYEYDDFIPMGFMYTSYVTPSDIRSLPEDQRALAMLSYAVLEEEDAAALAGNGIVLTRGNIGDLQEFDTAVAARKRSAAKAFEMSDTGFEAYYECDEAGIAFISTAYSKGFKVTVNGEKVETYSAGGLLGVPLKAGTNEVLAVYETPGGNAGMVLTGCAVVLASAECIVIVLIKKSRKRRTAKAPSDAPAETPPEA
ncbi:MAG: YfhO family protein [Clostridia bacterium]|nr:YfhO family protein [Clostridia bacterium]